MEVNVGTTVVKSLALERSRNCMDESLQDIAKAFAFPLIFPYRQP